MKLTQVTESAASQAHKLYFIDLFCDVAKITWMEQGGVESGDWRRFPFGSSGARFPFKRSRGGEVGAAVSHGRKGRATQKKSHQKIILLLFFLVVGDKHAPFNHAEHSHV